MKYKIKKNVPSFGRAARVRDRIFAPLVNVNICLIMLLNNDEAKLAISEFVLNLLFEMCLKAQLV